MKRPRKKMLPVDRLDQFIIGSRQIESGQWEVICYDKVNKVQHHWVSCPSEWAAQRDAAMLAVEAIHVNQYNRLNPIAEYGDRLLKEGGTAKQWANYNKRWEEATELMENAQDFLK